jgi:hypothetical protein
MALGYRSQRVARRDAGVEKRVGCKEARRDRAGKPVSTDEGCYHRLASVHLERYWELGTRGAAEMVLLRG